MAQVRIPSVKLGNQGLEVSKLGFGCMGLTGGYKLTMILVVMRAAYQSLKYAFSKGITFFDTSDIFGAKHANEILVAKALKQLPREKIQIATKFGVVKLNLSTNEFEIKGTPEYVRSCCEASLKRLEVEYIDLYYQHRIDTTVPIEITMGELKKLVEEANSSLQNRHPRFQAQNLEKNKNIYERVESLGKKHQCSPIQLALAWVLQQGTDVVPIPVNRTMASPEVLMPFFRDAGFGQAMMLTDFFFDNTLISAFVKHLHPKTHVFHMPWG
ncbi:hypothetical protein PIB30_071740 [Stylosanthes scabra]|uniref:NADP-dependent oxidoreductase domain-containing protein n=1 Tax=Stylosanthes scabra TaxID=79078 RepID=A0ABU6YP74_9FABA|nr:hypothetical protein [Stylosanthes scabra]